MKLQQLSQFSLGDMILTYYLDLESGQAGMVLIPADRAELECLAEHREDLSGIREIEALRTLMAPPPAFEIQPLVEFSIAGDPRSEGFSNGLTMRKGFLSRGMRYDHQESTTEAGMVKILTVCKNTRAAVETRHTVLWKAGSEYISVESAVRNTGSVPLVLDMLTSFNLGFLSPFDQQDSRERLRIHRLRSSWSSEGRGVSQSLESLDLERSWSGHAVRCERYGQVGSMPVRGWFPLVGVEDTKAGVFWGAQVDWAGSWQIELYRKDDFLCISGGMADREFGHWRKELAPGEVLSAPEALLTAAADTDFYALCQRLTSYQDSPLHRAAPEAEKSLPMLFNDWCTNWGQSSGVRILELAKACRAFDFTYFVIDAGWFSDELGAWYNGQGDWIPSAVNFPDGFDTLCRELRNLGFIPGLWFEFEVVGSRSQLWNRYDWLLLRDGVPIQAGERRFLDFRKAEVTDYLLSKISYLIESCRLGYLKVDYNDTVGMGPDDPLSCGEGLREHILAVYEFFELLQEKFPDLVVENCSSGGHRLVPAMINRTAMTSFSDAHEISSIPIIAANVHQAIIPRKCQIWAVLRKDDNSRRLHYSLAATFLGRMCISGDIPELSPDQREALTRAQVFYRACRGVIAEGRSRLFRAGGESFMHPSGWQYVIRRNASTILLVVHTFEASPTSLEIPLGPVPVDADFTADADFTTDADFTADANQPPANPGMRVFAEHSVTINLVNDTLEISGLSDFTGCAVLISFPSDGADG